MTRFAAACRTVRRLAELPPPERRLLGEAVVWLAAARVALAVLPFRWIAAVASRRPRRCPAQVVPAACIAGAVSKAAAHVFFRADCLPQALATQAMLRRRGVDSAIQFGARILDGRLAAHAWVNCAGVVVIGGPVDRFAPLASLPAPPDSSAASAAG